MPETGGRHRAPARSSTRSTASPSTRPVGGAAQASTKRTAKKPSTRPASSSTGLQLDPTDPTDAKIMARQQKAARAAGRAGQDRAAVTKDRADLQKAYDEGAAAAAAEKGDQGQDEEQQGRGARAAAAAQNAYGSSAGFLSRGSWSPSLAAPGRARDAGGLLVGLLLYTASITWVRYGAAGWRGWLAAKFLNKPMQGLARPGGASGGTVRA